MTLILTEGFEISGGPAVSPERWTVASAQAQTVPRTGARNVRTPVLDKTVQPGDEHAYFAAGAGYLTGYNVSSTLISLVGDAGTIGHCSLRRNVGGTVTLVVKGVDIATTPTAVITGTYHYFELEALVDDTVGYANFYYDGAATPLLSFSGDTNHGGVNLTFDTVSFRGGSFQHIDDIYILNGAGPAPFNARIGDVRCWPLAPNGNGNYSQLVGSDGNSVDNYLLVDEAGASPSSGDYAGSAVDGDKDTYNFASLVPTAGLVADVRHGFWGLKTDAGAKSMRSVVRTGGSDFAGADATLALSQLNFSERHQINPDTGNPWTIAEVNAIEAGVEIRP